MIKRLFHLPEDSPSTVKMDTPNSGPIDFIEFSLERWREGFLRAVLYITAGIGLIAILLYVFTSSTPLFIYLAAGFYLVFLAFTFLPMPYYFRAGFFVTLLNLISLSTLLDTGVFGSAMAFFLGATVIATLIFSPRIGTIYICCAFAVALARWLGRNQRAIHTIFRRFIDRYCVRLDSKHSVLFIIGNHDRKRCPPAETRLLPGARSGKCCL